jgi:hypothetical protein
VYPDVERFGQQTFSTPEANGTGFSPSGLIASCGTLYDPGAMLSAVPPFAVMKSIFLSARHIFIAMVKNL